VVLAVAALGAFMAFVDATIVNIALPSIARHFSRSGLSNVSWVLNAYNIVFAAFLVGGGQLADLLGRRRVFAVALVIFTLASAMCALAPTLGVLIAARVLQAIGATLLVPSSLAIVMEAHSAPRRVHAVALWSAVAALAAGIGPALGGVLITASSWRLVFLVNIPVGALALILTGRVLVESRAPGRRRLPDLFGACVLALAIAALVLAIVKGQQWGWGSSRVIGSLVAALLLGVYFAYRSSVQRVPVLDMSLLRIPSFALSNGATLIMASGFYAYTLCNVLFLTTVWRYSILQAGLAMTPGPFIAVAVARPASRAVERFGYRAVLIPGAVIWAAGMAYFVSVLGLSPNFLGHWLPGVAILGIGAGMTFPTLSAAAVGSVPGTRFAIATSLNSVGRQIGAALGVAILIAIIGTPSPLHALQAFQHGWLFAGGCLLAGAAVCAGVVLEPGTDGEEPTENRGWVAPSTGERPIPELQDLALPSLEQSAGERATPTAQSPADFLRNVTVFSSLSEEMREEIARLASAVSLKRGEWLFHEGQDADGVYVLGLGQLEVLREGDEPQTLNTLTRGAVLGELALLSDSTRSASVRALRDSELLLITREHFQTLVRSEPELTLGLLQALSSQLALSRAMPVSRRGRPVTIALRSPQRSVPLLEIADELSWALCTWGRVAVLYPGDELTTAAETAPECGGQSRGEALARFTALVERYEADHDHVILVCGSSPPTRVWDEFCAARADRLLLAVQATDEGEDQVRLESEQLSSLRGCELLAYGARPDSPALAGWIAALEPAGTFAVRDGSWARTDLARVARRLAGRSVGIVLSGGGARAFAHLGVLDVLLDAGLTVDRVAGVSMGAFVGGLLACGHDSGSIDACCYEEWVRRNPINDYRLPRASLIKGAKAQAMLERVFGETRIEQLARSFYCASVDLRRSALVIDRDGPLVTSVGASISLPLIAPPMAREERLLVDGSLLDNLPLGPMASSSEGPVLAVDIKGGEERPRAPSAGEPTRSRRLPALTQTMSRIALLSSANTAEAARRLSDMTISVRVGGVGLLEFHQIDQSRRAGRLAALTALEDPPPWLVPDRLTYRGVEGRRTVIRV
jgi:NTE family protein